MRAFLVDDSAPFRAALKVLLLAVPGIEVVGEAEEPAAAVTAICAAAPDVVLLDIALRQGSGLHVLEQVKACAPHTRVFMLTNRADAAYRARCLALGAERFFDKSADLDACVDACRLLAAREPAPPPAIPPSLR